MSNLNGAADDLMCSRFPSKRYARRMKRTLSTGVVAVVFAWVGTAQAATETVPLGYEQTTGAHPSVFLAAPPGVFERAISFLATFTADPPQPLEISHYISCTRGSENVNDEAKATVSPPFSLTIPATMDNADSCWITASAETPFDTGVPGTVRIDVTGTRRTKPLPEPYWQLCKRPRWISKGRLQVHDDLACADAAAISHEAWIRPERQGTVVRVRRYLCFRSGQGRQVAVRCSRGSKRLKLLGKLPS
jgi:hypothetical protein